MKESEMKRLLGIFRDEAGFWINTFGLKDWKVIIDFTDSEDNLGTCCAQCDGKIATLCLSTDWLTNGDSFYAPSDDNVRIVAFHEVLEMMLMDLTYAVSQVPSLVDQQRHSIIRRLENVLYPLKPFIGKAKNG